MMMSLQSCVKNIHVSDCNWVDPIYLVKEDELTDYTERAILLHNKNWNDICMQGDRV